MKFDCIILWIKVGGKMKKDKLGNLNVMKKLTLIFSILGLILFSFGILLNKRIDKGAFITMIIMLFTHLDSRQKYTKQLNEQNKKS